MRAYRWLGPIVLTAVALTSCELEKGPTTVEPPEFRVGFETFYAPAADYAFPASRLVVRTDAEWQSRWTTLTARVFPKPALPAVDFDTEMIVIAGMGTKGSGGYSIEIVEVETVGDSGLRVSVRETSPGSNCITTSALENPVVIARIPRRDGDVEFVTTKRTFKC